MLGQRSPQRAQSVFEVAERLYEQLQQARVRLHGSNVRNEAVG